MHAKLLVENSTWDAEASIVVTCSFTTGSCSLSVYKLTSAGVDWGKNNKETTPNPPGYGPNLYEKVQMILSDKFLGFFMIPEGGIWNYNFNGINFSQNMKYTLVLDNPKDFYHEMHRTAHFLDFAKNEDEIEIESTDREDHFQ